ncbi:UNVERIFIED_CONTAM: hypothetical protein Sradi_0892800 [Sesamum radiatum]|uniref:Uncharacterized protein n=1 Tax=Sesamum radiatum TaxID=300843 RepID=A0AAW2V1F8_SESRA
MLGCSAKGRQMLTLKRAEGRGRIAVTSCKAFYAEEGRGGKVRVDGGWVVVGFNCDGGEVVQRWQTERGLVL